MRLRSASLAASLALVTSLSARPVFAASWYVDPSAAAGGTGAMASPFQKVSDALGHLQRGDTVWLATGTDDEVVDIANLTGTGTATISMASRSPTRGTTAI